MQKTFNETVAGTKGTEKEKLDAGAAAVAKLLDSFVNVPGDFGDIQRDAADAHAAQTAHHSAPVLKLYRALVGAAVPLGAHAAWVETGHKAPGAPRRTLVFDAPGNGDGEAEARQHAAHEVLSCLVSWSCIGRVVQFGKSIIVLGYARVSP